MTGTLPARRDGRVVAGLLLGLALACGEAAPDPEGVLARDAEANRFELVLRGPAQLGPGEAAALDLAVEPRGRWKLAEDFPLRLEVEAPTALGVASARQGPADAARFDATGCAFSIDVTGREPGLHEARAELRFGLCEAELCEPVTREIAFRLRVE